MFPAAVLAAALLGTPRLCRWAPDVPSDAEPLFDLERSAFGPSNKLSVSIRVPVHGTLRRALAHEAAHRIERSAKLPPNASLAELLGLTTVVEAVSYTHLTLPTICSV